MTKRGSGVKISSLGLDHAIIEVDGTNLAGAVRAYTLSASIGNLTTIELEMVALPHEFEGSALVKLPQIQHDALVALGWTPPGSAE